VEKKQERKTTKTPICMVYLEDSVPSPRSIELKEPCACTRLFRKKNEIINSAVV
jgi:hypothetical protein